MIGELSSKIETKTSLSPTSAVSTTQCPASCLAASILGALNAFLPPASRAVSVISHDASSNKRWSSSVRIIEVVEDGRHSAFPSIVLKSLICAFTRDLLHSRGSPLRSGARCGKGLYARLSAVALGQLRVSAPRRRVSPTGGDSFRQASQRLTLRRLRSSSAYALRRAAPPPLSRRGRGRASTTAPSRGNRSMTPW